MSVYIKALKLPEKKLDRNSMYSRGALYAARLNQYECQECGSRVNRIGKSPNGRIFLICENSEILTFDHIIPKSFGGAKTVHNGQMLCKPCNHKRGNSYDMDLSNVAVNFSIVCGSLHNYTDKHVEYKSRLRQAGLFKKAIPAKDVYYTMKRIFRDINEAEWPKPLKTLLTLHKKNRADICCLELLK